MNKKSINRREFFRKSAVATAAVGFPYVVQPSALGLQGESYPSERITLGCIGVGVQGTANIDAFLGESDVQIVALCDVEKGSDLYYGEGSYGLEPARERVEKYYGGQARFLGVGGCDIYSDFRRVLERKDIDAVVVSTPDHWHAVIGILAAQSGKDIYCEVPLANSVLEGRELTEAVSQYERILQTGSYSRSEDNVRFACELVRNGRIGKLNTIRVSMPTSDPHHQLVREMAGPHPDMAPPTSLYYDMWLGPAPYEPYTEKRCHFWWRYILDYGGGEITNQGAHIIDIVQLGNDSDETAPIEIKAKGKRLPEGLFDVFMEYEFELKYDNGVRVIGSNDGAGGVKFEGEDGWIQVKIDSGELDAEPKSVLTDEIGRGETGLGRSSGHYRDFIEAIKRRTDTLATAEAGHRATSICHLVNIAMLTEATLEYNPRMERVTNSYDADRMLTRHFRSPWHI